MTPRDLRIIHNTGNRFFHLRKISKILFRWSSSRIFFRRGVSLNFISKWIDDLARPRFSTSGSILILISIGDCGLHFYSGELLLVSTYSIMSIKSSATKQQCNTVAHNWKIFYYYLLHIYDVVNWSTTS